MRTQRSLLFQQILMLLCATGTLGSIVTVPAQQSDALPKLTITLDVGGGDLLSKPDEPYRVRPDVHINVTAKNESSERLYIKVTNPYAQNRPRLMRSGKLVPYLADVDKLVSEKDTSPDPAQLGRTDYITLQPYESAKIDFLDLRDWYGPLAAGSYQLTNRYRVRAGRGEWSLPVTFNAVTNSQPQVPQIPKSTPNYLGTSIPDPPQQNSPWTEPRIHLPVNLISATARLFEQGLADPRGMEYREIKLVMGSYWHGGIILPTHGWILPGATDSQRFAVGWNGLVYPLVSIGGEADIRADVEAAIRADEEVRTKRSNADSSPFYRFRGATPEGSSLSATSLLPLKVCMLLRLGNVELAERVWAAWIAGMNAQINDDSLHLADPYLMLARDWTWAMFDRAVNAQMRGDDRMCWISATKAAAIEKSIRQEIPQRPILRAHQSSQYYLDFLKPLPSVIEDQERRVKYPHLLVPRDTTPLRQETIAQLIDYLDEAFAIQTSIPGGVDMSQDAVVEELIRRGKAAVEPLLNALEKDTRLTRSVESSRPWHYDRHFITVYETALQALRRVLSVGNEDFEDWETVEKGAEGRKTVAARLKKLAQQKGYLSLNLPPPF